MSHLTYLEAGVVGLIQGVTELFPISSLGHNVLLPAIIGGSWARDLDVSARTSPYLAFIVGLHVATAIALLAYFWRDWLAIIGGVVSSVRRRRVATVNEKMAWMVILGTIPVGLAGVAFDREFRVLFAVPVRAALFLFANGVILLAGERLRTRASRRADAAIAAQDEDAAPLPVAAQLQAASARGAEGSRRAGAHAPDTDPRIVRQRESDRAAASDLRLARISYLRATLIGAAQVLALLAGISRDGVTMVAGMFGGLGREDAARFAFLLATPVILAAGLLKLPELFGPLGAGIGGQILLGSVLSGVGAYVSVRFLVRYFQTRTLTPFAVYCMVAGLGSALYLTFS